MNRQKLDLWELVQSCVQMLTPLAKQRKINLEFEKPDSPCVFSFDPALFQRVLQNLISNSLNFTDPGGTVAVEGHDSIEDNQVELRVSDTGAGIPKESLAKIFDKFYQVGQGQGTRKGQGLGLAFCRLVMENHDGKIWAENKEGRGSSFVMQFPKK